MYSNIIIVGTGKIACSCLDYIMSIKQAENVFVYEYCPSSLSTLKKRAKQHVVEYRSFEDNKKITELLLTIEERTLIVSANNVYLFPKCICGMKHFTIINYHSALLPKYAGMNAITWTIFSGEEKGGITWHLIDDQIDHGDIIIQKTCDISDDMTAVQLNRIYDQLATDAFQEILPSLLSDTYTAVKQPDSCEKKYRKKEIPAGGELDLSQNTNYLYRLLRSLDYGAARFFPIPVVRYEDTIYYVKRYQFTKSDHKTKGVSLKDERLIVTDENGQLSLRIKKNKIN